MEQQGNREFVVDVKSGQVRQAGSDQSGKFMVQAREEMERSLFYLAYGALGLTRLSQGLHLQVCKWVTTCPPYRKLLLLPRDHLKTSMMRALSIHIHLQEREKNIYFPGKPGEEIRILYAGETATNAEHQLGWIQGQYEGNQVLRTFWPHKIWRNPRKESKRWNAKEFVLRRNVDFPEASMEAIGVGGAVTGRHYDVMQKDDLISFAAANSPIIMQEAFSWHGTSRSLFDDPDKGLEFIVGTHWATGDIYDEIIGKDDSVECLIRAAVEDGKPIFPEMFSLQTLARLERELGSLYPLLYMNTSTDPRLTDFKPEDFRVYRTEGGFFVFEEDERDKIKRERNGKQGFFEQMIEEERLTLNQAAERGFLGKGVRVSIRR